MEKGINKSKVKVFPFPIKPSYATRRETKPVLRRKLALGQKPFTVLFFFGAEGVGPVKKFLTTMIARGLSLQAVVICGRNKRLKEDMEALAAGPTGSIAIQVRGYVTNLAEYIAASDLVVGKSGPNQVFETLLQNRPIIISSFLANEKETTDWVMENRVGWLTRSPEHLATLLAKLASHPAIIEEFQRNISRLKLRSGAPEICEFLYGLVKQKRPPRKKTVGDALRRIRDVVLAEGEALSRRLEVADGLRRRKAGVRKTARKTAQTARATARRKTAAGRTRAAARRTGARSVARNAATRGRAAATRRRGTARRPPAA